MLEDFGWDEARARDFEPWRAQARIPGRVLAQHRGRFRLATERGELPASVAGRLQFEAAPGALPVAGDWVALEPTPDGAAAVIHGVLPRRGVFVRRAAGREAPQVAAANVDLALLVMSLNADFSPRRLERYLAAARDGEVAPLVVLTKSDLCANPGPQLAEARASAPGVNVLAVSVVTGDGMDALAARLAPGRTAALLGSSGVGKSSLVNALAGGERMAVADISAHEDKGRHTTTHRELITLPGGSLLLDTPGMRELGLWNAEAGVSATFADVEAVMVRCRFSDCGHESEPGCAVRAALEAGELDPGRWRSYRKLQRETAFEDRRDDPRAQAEHRQMWMKRAKAYRAQKKARDRDWDD
jgi:ribosome biogenesis GTPase